MSTSEVVLVVVAGLLLVSLVAWRLVSNRQRTRPLQPLDQRAPRVKVNQKIRVNKVEYTDPSQIADPRLRQVVEDAVRTGTGATRRFVINGVSYDDPAQIPDPNLRKLAEDAANLKPDALK